MAITLETTWKNALKEEFEKPYFQKLTEFVKQEYQTKIIYPAPKQIFSALDLCPLDKVKVVILGQDPYHGPRQANGLCFSVHEGIPNPPSLQNIYKEMVEDLNENNPETPHAMPKSGDLSHLAAQGVLLLNATLTVQAHMAGSHQNKGWEQFTDAIIQKLSDEKDDLVFMLWGSYAQQKGEVIDAFKHFILKAPHPSPLSAHRGFFGCRHFSQTNEHLKKCGKEPINWLP